MLKGQCMHCVLAHRLLVAQEHFDTEGVAAEARRHTLLLGHKIAHSLSKVLVLRSGSRHWGKLQNIRHLHHVAGLLLKLAGSWSLSGLLAWSIRCCGELTSVHELRATNLVGDRCQLASECLITLSIIVACPWSHYGVLRLIAFSSRFL